MKLIIAGAAAALISLGSMASAATFTIVGGSADSVPGGITGNQSVTPKNDVMEALGIGTYSAMNDRQELDGFSDGISIAMNRTAKVRVDLLGWEAGFYNSFTLDLQEVGKGLNGLSSLSFVAGDPLQSFSTSLISSLDFSFRSEGSTGTFKGGVANGDANTLPGKNFFASCVGSPSSRSCNTMYIFYDDDDVIGDNHDDLVIRISAVPLPAGMLLMLTGLGALALRRRKTA